MAHTTFYRKYRSANFNELVGQDHIIQTLSNAIQYNRLSHAYIFSGPRGTGKTSSARILAKNLNCRQVQHNHPCGTCDICTKITTGQSVDILEIDAASNTGVDHMRVINEQVNFAPVECRYRMFIIDEAHMLSTGAFNALLKTLEEPPSHVMFILATTEPHKIPPTIHSRCQHLQFRKLTTQEIVAHINWIAAEEGIQISPDATLIIARNADGCMRDALSLLDQIVSYCGPIVQDSQLQSMLGAVDRQIICQLISAIGDGDSGRVLQLTTELSDSGAHPAQLLDDCISVAKTVMFRHFGYNDTDTLTDHIRSISPSVTYPVAQRILDMCAKTMMDIRQFPDPMVLVQIRCLSVVTVSDPTIVRLDNPSLPPSDQHRSISAEPTAVPPVIMPSSAPIIAPESRDDTPVTTPMPGVDSDPMAVHVQRLAEIRKSVMTGRESRLQAPPSPPKIASIPTDPLVENPVSHGHPGRFGNDQQAWQSILSKLKTDKHPLSSILNASQAETVTHDSIVVKLKQDFQFFREKLREPASQAVLEPLISQTFGRSLTIRFPGERLISAGSINHTSPSPVARPELDPVVESAKKSKKINHIIALFDGTIVEN